MTSNNPLTCGRSAITACFPSTARPTAAAYTVNATSTKRSAPLSCGPSALAACCPSTACPSAIAGSAYITPTKKRPRTCGRSAPAAYCPSRARPPGAPSAARLTSPPPPPTQNHPHPARSLVVGVHQGLVAHVKSTHACHTCTHGNATYRLSPTRTPPAHLWSVCTRGLLPM